MLNEYYDLAEIDKTNANWRIIIGERSNGKTYQCKKRGLDNFFLYGKQFAYIRRTAEEVKQKRIDTLFADMGDIVQQWADRQRGKYSAYDRFTIIAKGGQFRLIGIIEAYENEKGKFVAESHEYIATIGYYFALRQANYDKGTSFPNVTTIIYDEFVTNDPELPDEFTKLLNLVSTIKRKRDDVVVYLLGNTVNRNSANLDTMQIDIRKLKQGEIKNFVYYGENGNKNTVAVEYCRHYEQTAESESYFLFGTQREKMIIKGEWETDDYPKFTEVTGVDFALILDFRPIRLYLYFAEEQLFVSSKREMKRIPYTTITSDKTKLKQRTIAVGSPYADNLKNLIIFYWQNGFCEFDDNLTGEDFRHILDFF